MSLACIIDVAGTSLSNEEKAFFKDADPWAFILFGRSTKDPKEIKALTADIKNTIGRDCLIFLDQEGGRVQRLKPPIWPQWPPNNIYGKLYNEDKNKAFEAVYLHHLLIAHEMKSLGINADCAPCLDLTIEGAHSVIGDRSFSSIPEIIAELGAKSIQGLHDGAVASVIKHIPGHGRAMADSHYELPIVNENLETLKSDFAPFKLLNNAPMAMTAHVTYTAIDSENCATLSKKLIDTLIRKELGFDGLLMTDDISMKALKGNNKEKAIGSYNAGCDVVMLCNAPLEERIDFASNCIKLEGKALERAQKAEAIVNRNAIDYDIDEIWAKYASLTGVERGTQLAINKDPTERV